MYIHYRAVAGVTKHLSLIFPSLRLRLILTQHRRGDLARCWYERISSLRAFIYG
jgi:hypothetical protein